ncbi:MAG: U32 family peptidase [Lachnospiraceae bacterium]|nr:U32 family peptidase [Lachnospiraceae bacterium]
MNISTELLAPAGSIDAMKAAFAAGADAVYAGGTRFGARAYADNPETAQLVEAIDLAHLLGKKLYLTVNTLLTQRELTRDLDAFLRPYYEHGLDGVIVQDPGVFRYLREHFPGLSLHISTQAGITGVASARLMQDRGASRVVLAREMSLDEIRKICAIPGMDVECFIHGALCYCYSGACLLSSMLGGRSGNRGRCAQPCRLAYRVCEDPQGKRELPGQQDGYVLSPKDLCTIDLLPDYIEAGVHSFKIEGRMKKPEYVAGVTAIYRKYMDLYLQAGRAGYRVDPEDRKKLADLFSRSGFTDGYANRHNDRSMITLQAPPLRAENEPWLAFIREHYIKEQAKRKIELTARFVVGEPAALTARAGDIEVTAYGQVCEAAQKAPTSAERILENVKKAGDFPFDIEIAEASCEIAPNLFYPMGAVNELRRQVLGKLKEAILERFHGRYEGATQASVKASNPASAEDIEAPQQTTHYAAVVSTQEQWDAVMQSGPELSTVYLESFLVNAQNAAAFLADARSHNKEVRLALPHMMREDQKLLDALWKVEAVRDIGRNGMLARNYEGFIRAKEACPEALVFADHSLYTFQKEAREELAAMGCAGDTVPLELNEAQMRDRGLSGSAWMIYGRVPMMVSANCLQKSTHGCKKLPVVYLKDRMGMIFPTRCVCTYCYNIIYNSFPISMHEEQERYRNEGSLSELRLYFSVEDGAQTRQVLARFGLTEDADAAPSAEYEFTRGHFKRGVL